MVLSTTRWTSTSTILLFCTAALSSVSSSGTLMEWSEQVISRPGQEEACDVNGVDVALGTLFADWDLPAEDTKGPGSVIDLMSFSSEWMVWLYAYTALPEARGLVWATFFSTMELPPDHFVLELVRLPADGFEPNYDHADPQAIVHRFPATEDSWMAESTESHTGRHVYQYKVAFQLPSPPTGDRSDSATLNREIFAAVLQCTAMKGLRLVMGGLRVVSTTTQRKDELWWELFVRFSSDQHARVLSNILNRSPQDRDYINKKGRRQKSRKPPQFYMDQFLLSVPFL